LIDPTSQGRDIGIGQGVKSDWHSWQAILTQNAPYQPTLSRVAGLYRGAGNTTLHEAGKLVKREATGGRFAVVAG
jgi:hypothetical protein